MALTDGIISYYKLDEGSGTTAFDSAGTNDGTLSNTRIWTTNGKINGGGDFTQGNDTIDLGNGLNLGDFFSVSCWVNFNNIPTTNGYYNFLVKNSILSNGWGFTFLSYSTTLRLVFFTKDNSGLNEVYFNIGTPSDAVNHGWYHCVVVKGWPYMKLYIDNTITQGTQEEIYPVTPTTSNAKCRIGGYGVYGGSLDKFIDGWVDEVGIWDRELTATEITELYNNGDGLQYPFLSASGKRSGFFIKNI